MPGKKNATPMTAVSRLRQDFLRLKKDPVPYIVAEPLPSNILEWHYVVAGPEDSPYDGGLYHGKLVFPPEFPFKPPSIYMITPNGRFRTNMRLCLSISDYHPDTWNPAWSVGTILTGLLSFMLEKSPTMGSVETSAYEKRTLSEKSHEFNLKDRVYCELFPELARASKAITEEASKQQQLPNGQTSSSKEDDPLLESRRQLHRNGLRDRGGLFNGAVTNFLFMCGFLAFSFVVRSVMNSLPSSE